jgi:ketosteroid isomerase-like protein
MRHFILAAFTLSFLGACQPGAAPLSDEDIAAIHDGIAAYTRAVLAGDCDAQGAMYSEDAVLLPQNQPVVEGRAAINAACEAEAAQFTIQRFTLTPLETDGYGDLAYQRGTWSEAFVAEGMEEPITLTGKYVSISRKQDDGSWLTTELLWNTDAPMPQFEEG